MSRESESLKKLRAERKAKGLVEVRLWVKPQNKRAIQILADALEFGLIKLHPSREKKKK